jgi:hypothetical protein
VRTYSNDGGFSSAVNTEARRHQVSVDRKGRPGLADMGSNSLHASWKLLAGALTTKLPTTEAVHEREEPYQLDSTMQKHMGYYFKYSGDELAKTKQQIHGYLSRRFMQQKHADQIHELDKRQSIHLPSGAVVAMPQN